MSTPTDFVLASATDPAVDVAMFVQPWPVYSLAHQPNGPVGIYKVATLEASVLQDPRNAAVNVNFAADIVNLGLGTSMSSLQFSSANASSVTFNATSVPDVDSSFVFASADASKTVTISTSALQTSLISTSDAFALSSSDVSGSAKFLFGSASATLQSGQDGDQQLNLFGSNVLVRAAQLNADADVLVKGALALQKVGTHLAVGQHLSSSDVSTVTIGGIGSGPAVATFQTDSAGGAPHTWLNGNSAYFSGNTVGLNWNSGLGEPTAELDVNGTIYARTGLQTAGVFNVGTSNVMTIGWSMSDLYQAGDLKKIILQSDVIEMVGDINQMNKTDLRIDDTAIYLGFIPGETTMDANVDAVNAATTATAPGTYNDLYYDGAGVILWNLPDGYQTFADAQSVTHPAFADYQQSVRWYKRGGMFAGTDYVPAWNRSSWEVSGGNLTLSSGTGHANYMFAIDYTDDSLKLYKVDSQTIKEVANFNSLA